MQKLICKEYNSIVLLGPTAVGKTSLGVRIADSLGLEIISADSRQVYKGLDLGSGKDLQEYTYNGRQIPYHMIDVTDLSVEYNLFGYLEDFYSVVSNLQSQNKIPFIVGGTGMYLDGFIRNYALVEVPVNEKLRTELEEKSLEEIDDILLSLKPDLHNKSDLCDRNRVIRAIEIAEYMKSREGILKQRELEQRPKLEPLVLGTTLDRAVLRQNIRIRLEERFQAGMVEEVQALHDSGCSWDRLERLGLEYRFIALYLQGKYKTLQEMSDLLYTAICQFAKRQETWFRGMEKKGVKICWLKGNSSEEKFEEALKTIKAAF